MLGFREYLMSPLVSFYLPGHQRKIRKYFLVCDFERFPFIRPIWNNKQGITMGLNKPVGSAIRSSVPSVLRLDVSRRWLNVNVPTSQRAALMRCKYVSVILSLKHPHSGTAERRSWPRCHRCDVLIFSIFLLCRHVQMKTSLSRSLGNV